MLRALVVSQLLLLTRAFHVLHAKAVRPTIAVARRSFQPLLAVPNEEPAAAQPAQSADQPKKLDMVDDSTFEQLVVVASAAGRPVLVDWYADWCGPCKLIEPMLADLHATGAVTVMKAKPEHTAAFRKWCQRQGNRFQVMALPTLILFDGGKPTKALVGKVTRSKLETFVGAASGALTGAVVPTVGAGGSMEAMSA